MSGSDQLSSAVVFRPLRECDVDEVVSLYASAFGDARPIDSQEVISWLRNPELDADSLRVLEVDGSIVGYGDLWAAEGVVALEVAAPGHWQTFLEWAEEAARANQASRVRVLSYGGRGFTMQIEFNESPPDTPNPPSEIQVRAFREQDAERLRAGLNEVFAQDPFFNQVSLGHFREFYLRARGMDPSLWLLAWDDAELAGFVLAFPERAGDANIGRVESLGVRAPWRGRGLGEALLKRAFAELHGRGLRRVALGVDASNETGAVRLYQRSGMRIERQADNWALDI
jgi:ribosomal protein S18 acetylase RimI-like enzyme